MAQTRLKAFLLESRMEASLRFQEKCPGNEVCFGR